MIDLGKRSHLQDLLLVARAIYAAGNGQNRRCFPRSRWTVEEEMRQPVLFDEFLNWGWLRVNAFGRVGG